MPFSFANLFPWLRNPAGQSPQPPDGEDGSLTPDDEDVEVVPPPRPTVSDEVYDDWYNGIISGPANYYDNIEAVLDAFLSDPEAVSSPEAWLDFAGQYGMVERGPDGEEYATVEGPPDERVGYKPGEEPVQVDPEEQEREWFERMYSGAASGELLNDYLGDPSRWSSWADFATDNGFDPEDPPPFEPARRPSWESSVTRPEGQTTSSAAPPGLPWDEEEEDPLDAGELEARGEFLLGALGGFTRAGAYPTIWGQGEIITGEDGRQYMYFRTLPWRPPIIVDPMTGYVFDYADQKWQSPGSVWMKNHHPEYYDRNWKPPPAHDNSI